jgi:hypothetical protein
LFSRLGPDPIPVYFMVPRKRRCAPAWVTQIP